MGGTVFLFVPVSKWHLSVNAVGKEVNGVEDSVIFRSLQALAVPLIGNACHVFMHGLNSVQVL